MKRLRHFLRRLRALRRADEIHDEIAEEMRFHVERRTEENERRGMAPDDARRDAEQRFGHMSRIREQCYDVAGGGWLEAMWQDVRYGTRMLIKAPGFTVVAVLSLALGIGANTAIFSLADKILFKTLPVEEPDRLVIVSVDRGQGRPGVPMSGRRWTFSYPEFVEYRDRNEVFEGLTFHAQRSFTLNEGGRAERIQGIVVSADYFSLLGVRPALGRGFLPEEDKTPGTHPVVVVSHRLWQRRFSADAGILGRSVNLNGHALTVVGILPSEFAGTVAGAVMDAYVPIMMEGRFRAAGLDPLFGPRNRELAWWPVLGRLKTGVSEEQAIAGMNALAGQIARTSPNPDGSPRFEPKFFLEDGSQGRTYLLSDLRFPLQLLMATVGLILLIACANVANLLLARAGARHKEIAIRLATGAGRLRLVSQLLTESLLLSALGGIGGVALAASVSGVLVRFTPTSNFTTLTLTLDNGLDWRVLAFTLAISVLTGILFGLVPALSASRPDLIPALKDVTTVVNRKVRYLNLRHLLVVGQVSLSVVVLVGAALCIRSLRHLQSIDAGFDTARVLAMSFDISSSHDDPRGRRFYAELLDRVRLLRGVEAASLSVIIPFGDDILATFRPEGYEPQPGENLSTYFNYIAPDYFRLLGIPLLDGRDFGPSETAMSPKVAIINEAAARRFWPGRSPVGERLVLGSGEVREIIGLVRDSKYYRLTEESRAAVFIPSPNQRYRGDMTLQIRTTGEPGAMLAAVRREVQSLDASLPIFNIKTLEDQKDDSLYTSRLAATMLTVFGILALLLAAVGLYGVMAYSVNCRTREIGIRLALGAQRRDVLRRVMAEGMAMVTIGLALGLGAAVAATRLVEGFVYGVAPTDPVSFAAAVMPLAGVALFANYLPARRAARTDPLCALRRDK